MWTICQIYIKQYTGKKCISQLVLINFEIKFGPSIDQINRNTVILFL